MVKQPITSFLFSEDQDIYYLMRQQLIKTGETQACELRIVMADGVPHWVHLTATSVPDAGGDNLLRVVMTDIAVIKEAQAQAQAQAARQIQGLVDGSMDAIIAIDADMRVVLYNPAAATTFGVPVEEAMGHSIEQFIPSRFREVHSKHVHAFVEHSQTTRRMGNLGQLVGLRSNGEKFPIEASISSIEIDGEKIYTVILRDITERKRTEITLQQSLLDKDALLKEIHHRVKNNLQVITSLLRLEARRSLVADTKEVLGYMRGRIRIMAQLHESLYRSSSDTFASVDLGVYLSQVATQAFKTQELNRDSVRLTLNLGSVQSGIDQATATGLLLNELVSNCLKHGFPEGQTGEVSVALQPANDQDKPADGRWCLRVSDTGVGLSPDFEDKRKASLGLQLVTDMSHQLNGTLVIDSVPGAGARFSVEFTVQAPAVLVMPP